MNDDFSDSELLLDGYNIFRFDRANRRGSGVLPAINSRLSCNRRFDLEIEGVEDASLLVSGFPDVNRSCCC